MKSALLLGAGATVAAAAKFNPLHHLGGNSPWFAGPAFEDLPYTVPDTCTVDQAVYVVRHGSRYPDPSAYNGWVALQEKFASAAFNATGALSFIKSWKPVLDNEPAEISQESVGGYLELAALGGHLRYRYPGFYKYGNPFHLWANQYPSAPRVTDSARLFARGYLGPNATELGTIYVINSTAADSVGNSLSASDSCPTFLDSSGGAYATEWANIYLPPIAERLNKLISGNLTLLTTDVTSFPYLCGYETQITGSSQWCDVFDRNETLNYEYAQDIRYYYGLGPGAGNNDSVQYPLLQGIVNLLETGPDVNYSSVADNTVPPPLVVAFTNDGQINELASITGIFSEQTALTANKRLPHSERIFTSSRTVPMRGTVAFERLNCGGELYVRILLNDAVYTVPGCTSGPSQSCPLEEYAALVAANFDAVGSFASVCNISASSVVSSPNGGVTFFTDVARAGIYTIQP